jgi:hypothetical protein
MSDFFLAFYLFALLLILSSPVYPISFHGVLCVFWMVFWVEILGFRFTIFSPFSHNTRLTSGFAGVLRVDRQSSYSPPLPTRQSVHCMRQGPSRCVWTTSLPTTSPHHGLRRTSVVPASPTGERHSSGRAWLSRATRGGSYSPTLIRASVIGYFPC